MTSKAIWRRRAVLMAVVGLLVAVPVTLLLRDGDDDSPSPSVPAGSSEQEPPAVGPGMEDQDLQVAYRIPEDWEEAKEASAIRLSSPDSSAEVVIAAPAPAADAEPLLEQTLQAFESQYEEVDVAPGSGREIGGLEATGAVVRASRGGEELRILVAVAPGDEVAYLVEVFTTAGVSAESLREAQAALNSLELKG